MPDANISVEELNRNFGKLESEVKSLRNHVDARFDRMHRELSGSITSLQVVHKDVYEVGQQRLWDAVLEARRYTEEKINEVKNTTAHELATANSNAEKAMQRAQWVIGLIIMFVLTVLAGFVRITG